MTFVQFLPVGDHLIFQQNASAAITPMIIRMTVTEKISRRSAT